MKQTYSTKEHFDDFWKIIQRHYLHKFEWHKLTLDDYLKMGTIERANIFALPQGLLKRMGRFTDETGKRQLHAMRFIRQLTEEGKAIYHAKVTRLYASGKRFDLPPWIEITPYQIQILLVESKSEKFELTPRQKKLVKRYFPKKDTPEENDMQPDTATKPQLQPEDDNMENPIYAANIPDDDMPQEDATPQAAPVQERQTKTPCYADAMHDIDKELHAMRDASTKDELKAAAVRVEKLLAKYAPLWPERCATKSQDALYYVKRFKERATA